MIAQLTPFEHLQRLCWNTSIWFGEWSTASVERRLKMCRDMTSMYLEFRQLHRDQADPWVWEAIDGLHPELAGVIAESLPPAAHQHLMQWMHNNIQSTRTETERLQQEIQDLPF
ncbi:hypothetical protein [Hymenobacter koreensis]|uniref:Uncharacterized protein n=1 Tax=Hymenobacter koreensis TaxID=1084523 RepID=A0ABP8JNG0_9BACT